jgi:transposase
MRQTELRLSKQEREMVEGIRSKGAHMAREFNRAHILAALDRKIPESLIMQVLGVGRTTIWRTRSAYLERGLEYALSDIQRPGQPKRYRAPEEAEVAALACSSPPAGAKRWTVASLTQRARRHASMRQISRESIRRLLKKTSSNPGAR